MKFTLPFSVDLVECAFVTLSQNELVIVDKPMEECTCSDNVISVKLTQEETLRLDCKCKTEIQVRVKTKTGDALASKIYNMDTDRILKDGVI